MAQAAESKTKRKQTQNLCAPFTSTPLVFVNAGIMGRPVKSEIILSDRSTVKVDTEVGAGGARILLVKSDSNDSKCGNMGG